MSMQTEPVTQDSAIDPNRLWHVFCNACQPVDASDVASICGTYTGPATNRPIWDRPDHVCVVCDELKWQPCSECGS